MQEITTDGVFERFKKIAEDFIDIIDNQKLYEQGGQHYLMLANKIIRNCVCSQFLSAHGQFGDSKILIRSAFESFVLMGYLAKYPEKIKEYEADNEIANFRYLFLFVKQGKESVDNLYYHYINTLSGEARKKLKVKGNIDATGHNHFNFMRKVQNAFDETRQVKPLAQKTLTHLLKLKEDNFLNFSQIKDFSMVLYDMNSQIAHGTFGAISNEYNGVSPNTEAHEKLIDCMRQAILIITQILNIMSFLTKREIKLPFILSQAVLELLQYMGFDLSGYERELEPLQKITQDYSSFLYLPVQNPYRLNV